MRHAIAQVSRDVCRALLTAGDESAKHVGTTGDLGQASMNLAQAVVHLRRVSYKSLQ